MPPRSVADATRFTPTGPHAFTTSNETPAERVARLRAAAQQEKAKKAAGTAVDRLIDRGRRIADTAHRITAVGLIAATVICGGLTIYAVTDMMMYNRRKRAELLAANPPPALPPTQSTTPGAAATVAAGGALVTATDDATRAAEWEANRPKGPWEKLKGWAMSGLTPADQQIKPIFEVDENEAAEKGIEAVQSKAEDVKQEMQNVAEEVKKQVAAGQEEKNKEGGVLSKVKGLWGGR